METRVELQIERVAPGGDGVAHVDGLVVFVPRTFPGDRVSARLVRGKEAWAKAVEVEVLEPAATRVASPCAHSQACGGCPWRVGMWPHSVLPSANSWPICCGAWGVTASGRRSMSSLVTI